MKIKIIILFCILLNLFSCNLDSKKFETKNLNDREKLIDSISNLNIYKYVGKNVSEFLKDKNFSKYRKIYIISEKPSVASSLDVYYNGGIYIELIPKEFNYMNTFSEYGEWNIEDFKKEKIDKINIYKNDILIKSIK